MEHRDDVIAGRYRVIERIGVGGMGTVWRAHDERLGRDVAVKRLLRDRALDDAEAEVASRRAMREARITARLHHPHAVPVYDVVEHEGQPCLVMEYFPSESLAELSAAGEPLPQAEVARIGSEVATALAAAHDVGIVHRDVKPGNVLVGRDGTAKISDFGIAHAMGDVSLTTTGLVTGTPAYLAPEVARGDDATPASDVFSLGSTLYTVLEGRPPFGTGENSMALLHKVAAGEVEAPRRSGPLTPLLGAMLAPRADDRPPMGQVARELRALEVSPATAVAPTLVGTPAPPTPVAVTSTAGAGPAVDVEQDDLLHVFREPPVAEAAAVPPVRRAPQGPPAHPPTDPPARGRPRRRTALLVLALVAAAALVALVVALLPGSHPGNGPQADSGTSASSSPSTGGSSGPSPSRTPTAEPTTSAPPPTPTPRSTSTSTPPPAGNGTPTAAELRDALAGYYALLPGNRDAGWARLTSRYQRTTATNRDVYESFWSAIDEVSVADLSASAPDTVTATLTYRYDDGRVYVERTRYRLVEDGGILKIDASKVLSSVQK